MSTNRIVKDVTYRTAQNVTRLGYYTGVDHVQTGELRIFDSRTNSPVWVRPERVFFLPND